MMQSQDADRGRPYGVSTINKVTLTSVLRHAHSAAYVAASRADPCNQQVTMEMVSMVFGIMARYIHQAPTISDGLVSNILHSCRTRSTA